MARLSEYRPLDFEAGSKNLYAPAGLDIGSETPEEIALAIASEVAALLSGRHGGYLRKRKGDIHATIAVASRDRLVQIRAFERVQVSHRLQLDEMVRRVPLTVKLEQLLPGSDFNQPASISKERGHTPPYAIRKNPTAWP